ncbi:ABC transporter permease [Bosea sp. (in: a-proteobacteria)]|uniref:ABC transporter permease n=1 Tax=Bosea sp. (in: a-proteobacteria) TaxID=1871050 RepID=UPI001AC02B9E|nr:ABC transporter permease [Bosea sp. (in: a-proteobacteria)]MBN9444110.1 ABC transporter permease [Bosea sp. (in: a-proteobacteria)]
MSAAPIDLPRWADTALVPLVSVAAALIVAGLVVIGIGENPLEATALLLRGALGSAEGIGFTLYYTTNFIFTGLAVAVAFHAGLFNIGGEGQATVAGIFAALACTALSAMPGFLSVAGFLAAPIAILAAAAGGAAYAFVPGWLQAKRGSHVVITTIMLNFVAATLIVYLLREVIGKVGSMQPETPDFPPQAVLAPMHQLLAPLGLKLPATPLNSAFLLALMALVAVWLLIWRTRLGYAIRTVGANPRAAAYAGISPAAVTMVAMAISGALAGGLAVNEALGVQHRLVLDFTAGYGFVGIAVALMGRGHPVGVGLAALLFGVLYQGGAELSFDKPTITRDMVVVIGGVLILFAGALDGLFRKLVALALGRGGPG